MNTSKPISTISYNSTAHLDKVLKRLVFDKKLTFYCFILHKGEDDEGGKKDHIHLYVEPNKRLNTDELKSLFDEPNGEMVEHCMPFQNSKFDDWEQYALHDPIYLKSKDITKKYHYDVSEFVTNDKDYLNYKIKMIDNLEKTIYARMIESADRNETFTEFFMKGFVPIQQIVAYRSAYEEIRLYLRGDKERENERMRKKEKKSKYP